MKLNNVDLKIARFLDETTSFSKRVSMQQLAFQFDISQREVRRSIERIIKNELLIIGNKNGYWVARNKEEIYYANRNQKARVISGIERLVANGQNIDFLYSVISKYKIDNDSVSEGQISIYE